MPPSAATLWLPVGFLCCIVGFAHADLEKTCTHETKLQMSPQGVCGPQLTNLLSLACMNTGYFFLKKRTAEPNKEPNNNNFNNKNQALHDFILSRKEASSFLGKRQPGGEQNIVCECCWHRCSMREIQQYCNEPPDLFKRNAKILGSHTGLPRDHQAHHVDYRSKKPVHSGVRLWD